MCVTVGMQSARGLVPAAAAAAPPACVRRPAQLRSVQVAARRSSRSRHVSLTPCASPDGDKLTSVQRSLETNSQALSESTTTTTTVTSTVTSNAEAVAALNALMEEERRLAALEAQLAAVRSGIAALYAPLGNRLLSELLRSFWLAYSSIADAVSDRDIDLVRTAADHRRIYDLVAKSDGAGAAEAIREHFDGIRARMRTIDGTYSV